jgi:hypothetical protein
LYVPVSFRAKYLAILLFLAQAVAAQGQESLRAEVTPAANVHGWHDDSVTIEYRCDRISRCPGSFLIDKEGAEQYIVHDAVANNGTTVRATTVLNIDKTSPIISIAPLDYQVIDRPSLDLTIDVRDGLSGVAAVWCNARPARVTESTATCTVTLNDGINEIVVSALDRAGNSASASTRMLRRSGAISLGAMPQAMTLTIGEERRIQIFDNAGVTIRQATADTSDDRIVSIVGNEPMVVRGLEVGTATIRASWEGRTTRIAVAVAHGPLPWGTTIWAGAKVPGFTIDRIVYAEGSSGMMSLPLERSSEGHLLIRPIATEPLRQVGVYWPAVASDERIIDAMGTEDSGALLIVQRSTGSSAIVHAATASQGSPWRYESAGRLDGDFARAWDGTVYVVETPVDGYSRVLALDSQTGLVKFRVPFPRSISVDRSIGCVKGRDLARMRPARVGRPSVPDGIDAAIAFALEEDTRDRTGCSGATGATRRTVHVMRISADGTFRTLPVATLDAPLADGEPEVTLPLVVPDGHEGTLVPMRVVYGARVHSRIVRITEDAVTSYAIPAVGEYVLGEDWAYTTDGQTLVAFDPVKGTVQWTLRRLHLELKMSTAGGGLVIQTSEGMHKVSGQGTVSPPFLGNLKDALPWPGR